MTDDRLELLWWDITQGTVGPDGIVIQTPGLDGVARLAKAEEPVLVEALVAQAAQSPFYPASPRGVFRWKAGGGPRVLRRSGPNRRGPEGLPSASRVLAQKDVGRPFARDVLRAFVAQDA